MRFAYADPPYPGKSRRYYGDHPDFAGEVDHAALIRRLADEFDGWALSTSASALPAVLALCPVDVRVGAWFRGDRPTRSARPLSAWEPVVYCGARAYVSPVEQRRLDALVYVARARTTDRRRVVGAKPAKFAGWLFGLLGALPGDDLVDIFPGSGGIARAWSAYCESAEPSHPPAVTTDASPVAVDDGIRRGDPSDASICAGESLRVAEDLRNA